MPAAEQPKHSPSPGRGDWGRALALVVIVALCAGFVSGSCTGLVTWDGAVTAVAGASAAGVALVVASVLFFLLKPNRRGIWRFAIICVAGYLAAAFLAWALFIVGIGAVAVGVVTGAVAVAVAIVGTRLWARGSSGAGRRVIRITALISGIAIAVSAAAVVWGFYANGDVLVELCIGWQWDNSGCDNPSYNNPVVFALIVGGAPPIVAATAARIGDIIDPLRAGGTPAPPRPDDGIG